MTKVRWLILITIIVSILLVSVFVVTGCSSSNHKPSNNESSGVYYAHISLEDGTAYDVVVKEYFFYSGYSDATWILLTLEDGSQILTSIHNVYLYTKDSSFNKVLEDNKR